MYMITDCLACRALKKSPAGAGRRCRSCPPAIHAAQHERAGRVDMASATGSTAGRGHRRQASGYAILHGLARRTAPQTEGIATRSRASRWRAQESPAEAGTPAGP